MAVIDMKKPIDEPYMNEIVKAQPIGRVSQREELAAAVLWLCSPASTFVIGWGLVVDGGFTAQ
jgi:NAD(P)-dependent dehydrogenase (short-subunit alcohol dehydrogenase family)